MDSSALNAAAAGLSAIAAIFAVVIGGISVRELRRVDERACRREAHQRDEALQMRLETMYPHLYHLFGVPQDRIPAQLRPAAIGFFGLYADSFTARRDELLPEPDAVSFLEEFDWWVGSDNGRTLWGQLRNQSWPAGFVEHVDSVARQPRPYSELPSWPAKFGVLAEVPGALEFVEDPSAELLRTAGWTLINLRNQGNSEFPPSNLDGVFSATEDGAAQLGAYADWLTDSGTMYWGRWAALLNGRIVGHIGVCEPHSYLVNPNQGTETGQPGKVLEVTRLFVDPRLQGRGIGTALLGRAVSFIHGFGCTPVLSVLAESRAALAMYQRSGWTERARFEGIQGENVLMVRPE